MPWLAVGRLFWHVDDQRCSGPAAAKDGDGIATDIVQCFRAARIELAVAGTVDDRGRADDLGLPVTEGDFQLIGLIVKVSFPKPSVSVRSFSSTPILRTILSGME